jgi:hypothetical protein
MAAKTYSTEKIADTFLSALALAKEENKGDALPEVLRLQNIYFDQDIIASVIQLLEDRKFIIETGFATNYTLVQFPGDKNDVIVQSILTDSNQRKSSSGAAFSSLVKYYRITGPGARFVRLGQVIDIQGKIEREAERKKWKERLVTSAIALFVSILTMLAKALLE